MIKFRIPAAVVCAVFGVALGDDAYYTLRLSDLTVTGGEVPAAKPAAAPWLSARSLSPRARIVLEGGDEAYVACPSGSSDNGRLSFDPWGEAWDAKDAIIAVKAAGDHDLKGSLYVPDADGTRLVRVDFTAPSSKATAGARTAFLDVKAHHYRQLLRAPGPGAAWYRWQRDSARALLGADADGQGGDDWREFDAAASLDSTYDLFTGGRAVGENLQLYRAMPGPAAPRDAQLPEEKTIETSTVEGITVAALDFKQLLGEARPKLDALAPVIPFDQHAVFLPSFEALRTLVTHARRGDIPALAALAGRSEDVDVFGRYERQLGLSLTGLSNLLGPSMVKSVAITGSDPYFPTGTSVSLVFEATNPAVLRTLLATQIRAAAGNAAPVHAELSGLAFDSFTMPDRSVNSCIATIGNAVIVTNSSVQIGRFAAVKNGAPAIASLHEYAYFRQRYPVGVAGETAFVFLSDGAIRRWCGPQWRIGASRRLRAAAIMADVTAQHLGELQRGVGAEHAVESPMPMRTIGEITLGPSGVRSSVYGTLAFLTPIEELDLSRVYPDEADAYARWRRGYERNWAVGFDPIALRLCIDADRVSADMTVMPLILGSEYRQFANIAQGVSIAPGGGDPHDSIAHFVMAINIKSPAMAQATGFARMMAPGLAADPLGWLGASAALYADADPIWKEMAAADGPGEFMERNLARLPIGLSIESESALRLTAFMAGLRAWLDQTSPGTLSWENRSHGQQGYVRVGLSEQSRDQGRGDPLDALAVYYALLPRALVASFREDVLTRAIDREAARAAVPKNEPAAWLGSTLGLKVMPEGLAAISELTTDSSRGGGVDRIACYANIEILNEWKRLFPDADPMVVHRRWWGASPVCPGGGAYVWNDQDRSMESTVYGSPTSPKPGPGASSMLRGLTSANFGITLEDNALRAKCELTLDGAK